MPDQLSMHEWSARVHTLCGLTGHLHLELPEEGVFLDDKEHGAEQRRDVILDNCPRSWKKRFDLSALERTNELPRVIRGRDNRDHQRGQKREQPREWVLTTPSPGHDLIIDL